MLFSLRGTHKLEESCPCQSLATRHCNVVGTIIALCNQIGGWPPWDTSWLKFNLNCPSLHPCGARSAEQVQHATWFRNAQCKFALPAWVELVTPWYKNGSPTCWSFPITRWWATWLSSRPQLMYDGNMIIVPYFGWRIRAHPHNGAPNYKNPIHLTYNRICIVKCSSCGKKLQNSRLVKGLCRLIQTFLLVISEHPQMPTSSHVALYIYILNVFTISCFETIFQMPVNRTHTQIAKVQSGNSWLQLSNLEKP